MQILGFDNFVLAALNSVDPAPDFFDQAQTLFVGTHRGLIHRIAFVDLGEIPSAKYNLSMRFLLASLVLMIGFVDPASAQDRRGSGAQTVVCAVTALASGQFTPANLMCFVELARSLTAPPPGRPPADQAAPIVVPPQSIAESAELIIKCYHPSATFVAVDIVQYPWQQGIMWNATQSAQLRIFWRGAMLGTNYETFVGFVERRGNFRVIYERTLPGTWSASNRCALRNWVAMAG